MGAILTIFFRFLPAIAVIFILLAIIWASYMLLSPVFRKATDEAQRTTEENASWIEEKFPEKEEEQENESAVG